MKAKLAQLARTLGYAAAALAITALALSGPVGLVLGWKALHQAPAVSHRLAATVVEQGLRLNQLAPPNAAVAMNSQKLTGLANGTTSGDAVPIGQDATSSLDGLMAAADKLRFDQRNSGPRFFYEDWDDFECGGADSTGAATLVTAVPFCKLQWRVAVANSGTAKIVTTGQDANHWGVVQLETVTSAASTSAIGRFAPSAPVFIFGSGQTIYDEWEVQIPTLSDATNTFTVDAGYASGMGSITPSDGVYLEESSATPSSGNWIGRVCVSSVCTNVTTTPVAAVAGEWERVSVAYDGTTITFAAKGTTIGTTTTPPSVALASFAQNVRQAGTVSRTALFDWNYDRRIVSAGRSP